MKYSELINSKAKDFEALGFLVDGGTVPVTIRIPQNLRDSAKEATAHQGMGFSAFVRTRMTHELRKRS